MSPPYASAKITLSCPLYAADFDPQNNGFLLVGGGGGEGRSGVGNKIVLLNASKKYEISELVELGLSREEDSVTSLAFAKTTDLWASAFAGINSSVKEQEAGNNQHLRSFLLQYPSRRKPTAEGAEATEEQHEYEPQAKALGKTSYFTPSKERKPETFQRILRLSKQYKANGPRLGAVATGLAPEGEIVTFAADTNKPTEDDVRHRLRLGKREEAADLDIIGFPKEDRQLRGADFLMAYCADYDVWLTQCYYNYDRPKTLDPQCIYRNPHPGVFASTKAPSKFRSLRFLTPTLLLVLQNLPSRKGSELLLMEISGALRLRKRLHKRIKSGTALSVAALPYKPPGGRGSSLVQHAVAVAGADNSITILTLDHASEPPYRDLTFKPHLFLTDVHPTSITSLTFSTHNPPTTNWSETPPQYLKLASTSIANTVIVQTLPLSPYPRRKNQTDDPSTYVLSVPDATSTKVKENVYSFFIASLLIGLMSFCLQSYLEIQHGSREVLGARTWLGKPWEECLAIPSLPWLHERIQPLFHIAWGDTPKDEKPMETFYGGTTAESDASGDEHPTFSTDRAAVSTPGLRDLLRSHTESRSDHHIIVQHHPADEQLDPAAETQTENQVGKLQAVLRHLEHVQSHHSSARKWEDLAEHEKETWKKRLLDAGEWAVEEGESVLKGVFFSGLAQGVGAAVGG